jgi:two-component system LytT family response regulator
MITAIHVEDEPRNIELLEELIKTHCAGMVTMCGNARNNKDAVALIKAVKPQLVYLDIELNDGNSFQLLEDLVEAGLLNFQVIFITAFNDYAVKAFRYNALDYLLKPISSQELREATAKAVHKINNELENGKVLELLKQLRSNLAPSKLALPVNDGIVFIDTGEIIKIEAKGSYSLIYPADGKKITSTKTLKDIEDQLPESHFLRVHHSWVINLKYLKKYFRGKNGYMEMEDGSTVQVSIRKKNKFLDLF